MKHITTDPTLTALDHKHHALLLTGNIFDLVVEQETDNLFYRPVYVAEKLFERGYFVLRYSRSSGFTIHRQQDYRQKGLLDQVLQRTGLTRLLSVKDIRPTEVVELFRAFRSIAAVSHAQPFAFIIDYAPHLVSNHNPDIEMQIVAESINDIACQPSVQKSGNCILVYAHAETDLPSLFTSLHKIHYSYPDQAVYEKFFEIIGSRTSEFAATSLSSVEASRLARGLNLMDLASLFKEASAAGIDVTSDVLLQQKKAVIDRISEGTLTVMPVNISFDDLAGMDTVKRILLGFAQQLQNQSPTSPRAICFAGPPGTGKTTLAQAMAGACGFNLVALSDAIKSKWVGESEERLSKALQLIESMAPVMLFIDEVDQAFQNRSQASMDGGVSAHYLKTIFQFAAREDLRGKILIAAATNTPQLLDPALQSRFIIIPVLEAMPEELAAIFPKIQERLTGVSTVNPMSKNILMAAEIIYKKGGTPRQLFDVLNKAIMMNGDQLNDGHILQAAERFRHSGDAISVAFSSLSAIRLTAFEDYFPWYQHPDYPFPWYLEGILDPETLTMDENKLDQRIQEFKQKSRF